MAEKVLARKGNWAILKYYGNGKFTYWVVSLPDRQTTLQFSNLQKARQYFNRASRS